jgi:hypothetical protein
MNWDAIAAIAEVVGALAVLITLAYLAIQTRDNVKIMRSKAIWDAQVSFVEVNELLADDGVVAEAVYKAISEPDSLTDKEIYRIHRFNRGWFQRMEAQFALYKAGILDREVWELRLGYAQGLLAKPPFKEWWEIDKNNSMFTEDFIKSIDGPSRQVDISFMGVSSK